MADTLKIMLACGAPGPGGAQSFFLRLVRAFDKHPDTEVMAVVRKHSWVSERLDQMGIKHETAGFGGALDIFTKGKISQLIDSFKPDVAQTFMNRASRFMPRDLVPTIGRMGGYYNLKYYQGMDYLVGNTQDICSYMQNSGWPKDRVNYLPNFVDMPEHGFRHKGEAIRAKYHIPDNMPVLLLAGRLHKNKGFDVALHALAELPDHIHMLIAGEGEEEKALKALASKLGVHKRAHFTGWVNHVSPLCAASDIFVVPSRTEPLGNVVLEGWAHGLPVVAADSAGPKQLITDGKNGLLVPIEDAPALAAAIHKVAEDPALSTSLGEAGLETLREEFSEEAVVNKHLAFYREMLERSAR